MDEKKLISMIDLFKKSFEMYQQRFWIFIKLMAVNILIFLSFFFIIPIIILIFLFGKTYWSIILLILLTMFVIVDIVIGLLVQISLIFAIRERESGISVKESLLKAWLMFNSYCWVCFLAGLYILGGFMLLIVPGIIFSIWFTFSAYVLIVEGKKGKLALMESKRLVKGYWWQIFWRFLVIGLAEAVISYVPFFGPLINLFLITPFAVVYSYLIYEDLKRIKNLPV